MKIEIFTTGEKKKKAFITEVKNLPRSSVKKTLRLTLRAAGPKGKKVPAWGRKETAALSEKEKKANFPISRSKKKRIPIRFWPPRSKKKGGAPRLRWEEGRKKKDTAVCSKQ